MGLAAAAAADDPAPPASAAPPPDMSAADDGVVADTVSVRRKALSSSVTWWYSVHLSALAPSAHPDSAPEGEAAGAPLGLTGAEPGACSCRGRYEAVKARGSAMRCRQAGSFHCVAMGDRMKPGCKRRGKG